jgi:chemotaxis-related protein WspD
LLFQLGNLRLALPTHVASAVAPTLHIARIPHRSGTVLLGLAAFRGDILPCCSLARLLDLPQVGISTPRSLILEESPGRRWVVPIDSILGVHTADHQPSNEPALLAAHWLSGSFRDDSGTYHLLNHEVIFRQINLATA